MNSRRHLLLFLLLIELICAVKGNVVFKVQHKFGGRGKGVEALRALKAHDSGRHGRLLSAVDFQLGGNGKPTDAALYYTKISIGSPPNDYYVQVDTGSDILWVNCKDCDRCPTKTDLNIPLNQYDITASSTGKKIMCDQEFCKTVFTGPSSDCKVGMACEYGITYGDKSKTEGFFVNDYIRLDQVSGNLQTTIMNGSIAFGCSTKQSGDLDSSSQAVDGIIGFGQLNTSVLSQLALSKKVKKVFSHCLDGRIGGGIFAIGELAQPKVNSIPLVKNEAHYNVLMKAVDVGGQSLDLSTDFLGYDTSGDTIIDSGTTLAYLPSGLYNQVIEKMMVQQPDLQTHSVEEQFKCFWYNGNVDDGFPVVTFHFQGKILLAVYPHDYLFEVRDNEYCIGWQSSGMQSRDGKELTLLGDIVLSNKIVLYDLENQTIGWTDYDCSSSIKVIDDVSGNIYSVSAHDITSCSSLIKASVLPIVLLIAILLNSIE
ncbi:aspartic proteinase-like protein 2 [Olea europaea var. sylvestris]|uniref:aspartic proteinase-like protein 2 n=1 Tax=Olea europaea var. sylvestris TaxID=158386 RepID=UPI000C1CDF6A|nr:aspartic proteinase-like protein 2 [Olea europaea var. sylvestris]